MEAFIDLENEEECLKLFNDYKPSLWSKFTTKLYNIKWWLLHRFHRHHIINTGLTPAWYDKDYLMEVVIAKLLIDFFEQEKPDEQYWNRNNDCQELTQLYRYFKAVGTNCPFELSDPDDYKVFNDNLHRVVELRGYLWT